MSDPILDPDLDLRVASVADAEEAAGGGPGRGEPGVLVGAGGTHAGAAGDAADDVESVVRDVLRDRGLRYSRPREAILAFMAEAPRHVSAESLYQALRDRGEDLSLSTVYLNLGVLVEAGLLREFKGAHGESLYDASVEPHYHLICRETGEVVDVPMPTIDGVALATYLKAYVERLTGWEVDEAHLSLQGRPRRPTEGHREPN